MKNTLKYASQLIKIRLISLLWVWCLLWYFWGNQASQWKLNDCEQNRKPANLYCTCAHHDTVGHSFPRPRSYVTCHFPFTEMLAYKKNRAYNHFQQEAKRGTKGTIWSLVLYITFVFHTNTRLCVRGFHSFSPIPPSHSGQCHSAGCRWHSACQVHLCLMNGRLKQTQLESLSINVVCTCLILPQSEDIQTRSVICVWMSLLLLCYCAILRDERHEVTTYFIYSV